VVVVQLWVLIVRGGMQGMLQREARGSAPEPASGWRGVALAKSCSPGGRAIAELQDTPRWGR